MQKKYDQAEPYIQKAVKIHEQLTGPQGRILVSGEKLLCGVYDGLREPAKVESCNRQLIPVMEQVYGANSAVLAPVLASESKALRALGRTAEVDEIDRRVQGLQQNTPGPNSSMVTPH